MDEDECDYRSPIGRIIKQINSICKKPKIDNQLNEALEVFNDCVNEQQKYLKNGIFKTNFAETALFLQSCAELYGKKIDLLWDEIIAFLTRLIKYDCEHEKEQGIDSNADVITKLEERRNKYKRKRKSKKNEEEERKLAEESKKRSEDETNKPEQCENHTDDVQVAEQPVNTNSDKPGNENADLMNIPGWNDIQCLFEQIDEKQLPDKNNLLAILKVCAYGRMTFLKEKNLPFSAPYTSYKEDYLIFRKKFFEEAAKKWQDVTFDTFEDLHKVLIYLSQKEKRESMQKTSLEVNSMLSNIPSIFDSDSNNAVTTEQLIQQSDDDSLFELSFVCDETNKIDKSDLFVHLEKLSSEVIDNKLRQDSGFYEFGSDDSCNSFENVDTIESRNELLAISQTINDSISNLNTTTENALQIAPDELNMLDINSVLNLEENKENEPPFNKVEDDLDNKSVLSDHDYCVSENLKPLRERKRRKVEEFFNNIVKNTNCIVCKKTHIEKVITPKENKKEKDQELMPPPSKKRKLSHKQIIKLLQSAVPTVKESQFERFFIENYQPEFGEGTTQRIDAQENENMVNDSETENLEDNNICNEDVPSNQSYSENFNNSVFSEIDTQKAVEEQHNNINEKEDRDIQFIIENLISNAEKNVFLDNNNQLLNNSITYNDISETHSDNDDTLSVLSEHSYSQFPNNSRNDSGFVDISDMIEEEQQTEPNIETLFEKLDNIVGKNSDTLPFEEEYQRLLNLLDESQKDMINEREGRPTESQRREQEALELHSRVEAWTNTIVPVLNELNEKDFDIHEYGSKIMEGISVNESKSFSSIVQGMNSAEVTRYFISSLQLANTNNIEICGVKLGELSNDSFEIKVVNKRRYHEHIIDFQAPSKEALQERLKRLSDERNSEEKISDPVETNDNYPYKKRRKVEFINGNSSNVEKYKCTNNVQNRPSKQSSCYKNIQHEQNSSTKDTNNNSNKNKEHFSSSKSFIMNPQKGKSIKRKAVNISHVSFEGSQAPQAISAQITGPRQLHSSMSSSEWNQPSTSYAHIKSNGLRQKNLDTLDQDFQRLSEVQKLYPHYQMQSTPRNDMTCSQNVVYSSNISPRVLFK